MRERPACCTVDREQPASILSDTLNGGLFDPLSGRVSRSCAPGEHQRIAAGVIDPFGNQVTRVGGV